MNAELSAAVLANGCFWCTEAVFQKLKGVISVVPGYTGGAAADPSYDQVSTGATGHAEAIKIIYDPAVISYRDLLIVFFYTHDPTTLNRQGSDVGPQYRSAIFYADEEQKQIAEDMIKELTAARAYPDPIVTEVAPLDTFYEAEDYHRDYYAHHQEQPYCRLVIAPKLQKMQDRFAELLK